MPTRLLLAMVCAATAPAVLPAAPQTTLQQDNSGPNILIFIADDHGGGDLSIYGHPVLETPNIDRIGREGMRFDRAFLTTSSCSPSRSSILTGRYPHSAGAEDLHTPLPAEQKTLARVLGAKSYHNLAVGKWHLGEAEKAHWAKVVDCDGGEMAQTAIDVLRDRPRDRPFLLWAASKDPHRPFDGDAIAQPHAPDRVRVPPYLPDHPLIREDIARYYDEIARFDEQVGRILAELEAQGVLDETVVVYLSDNGMPFPRAKTTLYDSGVRTPLLVRYPPVVPQGVVQNGLFSVVDLTPTLLELAGVEPSAPEGVSQVAMWRDPLTAGREAIYAEANWHDFEHFTRAVRSERFLLVRNYYWDKPLWASVDAVNSPTWQGLLEMLAADKLTPAQRYLFEEPRPFEEFYDLQTDPNGFCNVAEDPVFREELNRHRTLLDNWRVATGDLMPEQRRLDGWTKHGDPLPHNQPWYDRYREQGGKSDFGKL